MNSNKLIHNDTSMQLIPAKENQFINFSDLFLLRTNIQQFGIV